MANDGYHEPIEELSDKTRVMHKAITYLMEELAAVVWYNQRVDASVNDLNLDSDILQDLVTEKGLIIIGAEYCVKTGAVNFIG